MLPFPHYDKLVHFLVFGLIATAWFRWLQTRLPRLRAMVLAWILTAGFGALDEIHQSFVATRHGSSDDWIANALGAATAISAYRLWPAYRRLLEWEVTQRAPAGVAHTPASASDKT